MRQPEYKIRWRRVSSQISDMFIPPEDIYYSDDQEYQERTALEKITEDKVLQCNSGQRRAQISKIKIIMVSST